MKYAVAETRQKLVYRIEARLMRVPVDTRTKQPYGLLHGGVSVVLAETLGSCGAVYTCPPGHRAVGLDINANHLRGATSGWVTGITRPVHIGRSTQVWDIRIEDVRRFVVEHPNEFDLRRVDQQWFIGYVVGRKAA